MAMQNQTTSQPATQGRSPIPITGLAAVGAVTLAAVGYSRATKKQRIGYSLLGAAIGYFGGLAIGELKKAQPKFEPLPATPELEDEF